MGNFKNDTPISQDSPGCFLLSFGSGLDLAGGGGGWGDWGSRPGELFALCNKGEAPFLLTFKLAWVPKKLHLFSNPPHGDHSEINMFENLLDTY